MTSHLKRFVSDESGATAVEYGLVCAMVAVAVIAAFSTFGANLTTAFTSLTTQLNTKLNTKL